MKKTYLLILVMTTFLSTNCLMASVYTISTSKSGIFPNETIGNKLNAIVDTINTTFDNTTTIIINFDIPGKYYFNTSLNIKCNTIIDAVPGVLLEIPVGFNFIDDCMFGFAGGKSGGVIKKISVSVSNLTIKLADHSGILWKNAPKFIFKIYHSNDVKFFNVKTFLNNALCTNLDMRICSNITISDCEFENYNNYKEGGTLWIRGDTENVKVYNNKFRKYGNDEIIAIYGDNTLFAGDTIYSQITKKNIFIYNNDIYYGYDKPDKDKNRPIDRLFYIYTSSSPEHPINFEVENINIRSNNFIIDDPVRYNISVWFDKLTTASNINFENNNISYSSLCKDTINGYIVDFDIINENEKNGWISICNNRIYSNDYMVNNYGNRPHICLSSGMAKTLFKNNTINSVNGITLFNVSSPSKAEIILSDNICSGLKVMGVLSSNDTIKYASINAYNNIFRGDTKIYIRAYAAPLMNADLVFRNNNFYSTDYNFFLQNFAREGTVIFDNNFVKLQNLNSGSFYSYYEARPDVSIFKDLIIRNNTYYNISSTNMYNSIKKCNYKIISNNLYKEGHIEPECNCDQ